MGAALKRTKMTKKFNWGTEVGYGRGESATSRGYSMCKGPVAREAEKDYMAGAQRAGFSLQTI